MRTSAARNALVAAVATALLTGVLVPTGAAAPDPSALALIARVEKAYGGAKSLARVRAYRMQGSLFALQRHEEAPTVRVFERPRRFKVLIDYEDGHEARVYDGERAWRAVDGGAFEPAFGPMQDATALQAARAAVPWILIEKADVARSIDPFEHGGMRLSGLEIEIEPGLRLQFYVDSQSGLVRISRGLIDRGAMATHFETFYDDWRRVEGVRFAFHEENWASGTRTGTTTVSRVTVNPKLTPGEFSPPTGGRGGKAR